MTSPDLHDLFAHPKLTTGARRLPEAADKTTAQLMEAIADALRDRDFTAMPGLMSLLAVRDPHAAQAILDVLDLAGDAA